MQSPIDYSGIAILIASITGMMTFLGGFILNIMTFTRTARLGENVQKIEVATNSMKDALVKSTKESALLQGAAQERTEQKARDALVAAGTSGVAPKEGN